MIADIQYSGNHFHRLKVSIGDFENRNAEEDNGFTFHQTVSISSDIKPSLNIQLKNNLEDSTKSKKKF